MSSTQYTSKNLDHLGLVAGFCQEAGIADIINATLGVSSRRQVNYGQLFVAMILNGLGFTGRTMHMYSEYFEDKPLSRLIGDGINAEHINDDALGRCLDALYEHGVSTLYQQISEKVVTKLKLPCKFIHLDSTSFHYDGQANADEEEPSAIHITRGYSRDHRPDLNQVVLNLICENQAGIPVYMKPANGNNNDVQGFKEIVKSHITSLKAAQQCRYLVADAALYVKETLIELAALSQLFITRVPQTLVEAKSLINDAPSLSFKSITAGYQGVWHRSEYGGVKQKWLLIRSEQAAKREQHNLDKRMLKQSEQSRKSFKKLCQQEFACKTDAKAAFVKWQEKQPYQQVDVQLNEVPVYARRGRPNKREQAEDKYYQLSGVFSTPLKNRKKALEQVGLFIIASNDLSDELTMEEMLSTYKSQQSVEKGFRFLKSPDFLTSAFYLKKPERIEALLMVMTTCLMVYAALEHRIRKELVAKEKYFPDMKKKPSQRPTARWVFQCFQGVTLLTIDQQQELILNLKARQSIILDCLGGKYRQIYS